MQIIEKAEGPVLVHCWHGSDRTGVVIAMYRILYQGWTKEEAIAEMAEGGYGHHAIYGNIVKYIETVDIAAMKQKVAVAGEKEIK